MPRITRRPDARPRSDACALRQPRHPTRVSLTLHTHTQTEHNRAWGAASAFAQEAAPGPGKVEVTYTPGGAAYVTSKGDAPSFGNYTFGTGVTFTLNRFVGIGGMRATTAGDCVATAGSALRSPRMTRRSSSGAKPATAIVSTAA